MKDLSRHIEYLLCEHDSVAIPGIGTFIIKELPARYYIEECSFLPPIRSVYLDTGQKHDDNKLETCLIQLHRVTRIIAQKWIAEYVDDINQALMETGTMDVGTIGRLSLRNNEISFEVCEAGVNSPELYGLDSFHMPKLPPYAHKGRVAKDPTHFTIRLKRSTVHRAMTAAAMLIVAFTLIIPNYGAFNFNEKMQAQLASAESLITFFNTDPLPTSCPVTEEESTDQSSINNLLVEEKVEQFDVHDTTGSITTNNIVCDLVPLTEAEQMDSDLLTEEEEPTSTKTSAPEAVTTEVEVSAEMTAVSQEDNHEVVEIQETKPSVETPKDTKTITSTQIHEVKGYCIIMASAITHKGAKHLIGKLNKEGFTNAVKYNDNGMLRVVLTGYPDEESARSEMAVVRKTDKLYSGSWLKFF